MAEIDQSYKDGKLTETNVPATVTEGLMNDLWDILSDVESKAMVKQKSRLFNAMIERYTNLKNRTCGVVPKDNIVHLSYKSDPLESVKVIREYLMRLQDVGLYSIRSEEVIL